MFKDSKPKKKKKIKKALIHYFPGKVVYVGFFLSKQILNKSLSLPTHLLPPHVAYV